MDNELKEFKKYLKILHDIGGEQPGNIVEIVKTSKPQYLYKIEKWLDREDMGSNALLKDILKRQVDATFFRLYASSSFLIFVSTSSIPRRYSRKSPSR